MRPSGSGPPAVRHPPARIHPPGEGAMSRSLLQLLGLSLIAILVLIGLECQTHRRPADLDEAPDLQLITAARSPR